MTLPVHPRLKMAGDAAEALISVAQALTRAAARRVARSRPARNTTLRPGADTPMWNALVLAVRPHLRVHGEKSNLARELGVPPQRIHEFFVARTAAPDAERTLIILNWLATRPAAPAGGTKRKAEVSRNT
jgi:hypothetical protein